jgi:hypothetical protein
VIESISYSSHFPYRLTGGRHGVVPVPRQIPDDFQSRSSEIGKTFARWCEVTLKSLGFSLLGPTRIKEAGVEIDQVAKNRLGEVLCLQFKGSSKPPRQGMRRSDTVKKALCDAFLLDRVGIGPYIIITSHKPLAGSSSEAMMSVAGKVVFDLIGINDDEDMDRLKEYADGPLPWRSKIVAKRQRVQEEMEEAPGQMELFTLERLRGRPRGALRVKGKKKIGT